MTPDSTSTWRGRLLWALAVLALSILLAITWFIAPAMRENWAAEPKGFVPLCDESRVYTYPAQDGAWLCPTPSFLPTPYHGTPTPYFPDPWWTTIMTEDEYKQLWPEGEPPRP